MTFAHINLNTASIEDLASISGLPKERAQLIIDYREEHGEFRSWDDVKNVPGLSQRLIEQLKKGGAGLNGEKAEGAGQGGPGKAKKAVH